MGSHPGPTRGFSRGMAMRVLITVVAGPYLGEVFSFTGHDTFLVGRSNRAHFRLPEKDDFFSRLHFMLEVSPPFCRLSDLKSTNGTYVNGQRVQAADLSDGDLIQGGQTVLRISLEDVGDGTRTAASCRSSAPVS